MQYPSEPFTRTLILLSVKYLTRQRHVFEEISKAQSSSAVNTDRFFYFQFGGVLFHAIGYILIVFSIGGIIASVAIFHWVSFGWLVFIYPGWFFYCISKNFNLKAAACSANVRYPIEYRGKDLLYSTLLAALPALFIVAVFQTPDYTFQ